MTAKPICETIFPAARKSRKLTMTKKINYCNALNSEGIQFYYNTGRRGSRNAGQRLQVYIDCDVELEYKFKPYTDREDRRIYGDGEIVINWKESAMAEINCLTVDLIDLEGNLVYDLFESSDVYNKAKISRMLNWPLDDGQRLGDAIWEKIRELGPNQDEMDCWVETIEELEKV